MGDKPPLLDHIIIAVHNLDLAARDFAQVLGYPPGWRGFHLDDGTRNIVFRLENTCLELLAPDRPGPGSDPIAAHLDAYGEGLFGLAFGVDDIDAFAARLRASGMDVTAPRGGSTTSSVSGTRRQWRSFSWPMESSRGIFSFALRHDSPPDSLPMTLSGATHELHAVDHIVINTSDGDAAAAFYGDLLGLRLALRQNKPQWGGDMLFFRTSHMSIEVIATAKHDPHRDSLWGIALRANDIASAYRRLVDAGVEVSALRDGRKPHTRVCTVKSHCCGIPTLLIGPAD
jgi:catechol 2,3-dioxygenase-like lactoylglutathione lyase family enzyme